MVVLLGNTNPYLFVHPSSRTSLLTIAQHSKAYSFLTLHRVTRQTALSLTLALSNYITGGR